jgi:hypothetical protein
LTSLSLAVRRRRITCADYVDWLQFLGQSADFADVPYVKSGDGRSAEAEADGLQLDVLGDGAGFEEHVSFCLLAVSGGELSGRASDNNIAGGLGHRILLHGGHRQHGPDIKIRSLFKGVQGGVVKKQAVSRGDVQRYGVCSSCRRHCSQTCLGVGYALAGPGQLSELAQTEVLGHKLEDAAAFGQRLFESERTRELRFGELKHAARGVSRPVLAEGCGRQSGQDNRRQGPFCSFAGTAKGVLGDYYAVQHATTQSRQAFHFQSS